MEYLMFTCQSISCAMWSNSTRPEKGDLCALTFCLLTCCPPNWDTSSEFGGARTVTCTSRYMVLAFAWSIGSYLFGTLVNASNTTFVLRDGRLFTNAQSIWGACGQNTTVANRGESISQPYWEALVSSLVTTPGVSVHSSVLEMPAPMWK